MEEMSKMGILHEFFPKKIYAKLNTNRKSGDLYWAICLTFNVLYLITFLKTTQWPKNAHARKYRKPFEARKQELYIIRYFVLKYRLIFL